MTDKELQEYRDKKAEERSLRQSSTGQDCLDKAISWYLKIGFEDGFNCAIELMRKENETQLEMLTGHYNDTVKLLEQQNEKLVSALEFYADRRFYQDNSINISIPNNKKKTSTIEDDQGRRARKVLKQYRGEK